jgi:hypothetical protein
MEINLKNVLQRSMDIFSKIINVIKAKKGQRAISE